MNHNLEVVQQLKELIRKFLAEKGLQLSGTKTKIVHTRKFFEGNNLSLSF